MKQIGRERENIFILEPLTEWLLLGTEFSVTEDTGTNKTKSPCPQRASTRVQGGKGNMYTYNFYKTAGDKYYK